MDPHRYPHPQCASQNTPKTTPKTTPREPVPNLGRIGALAEDLRCAGRAVVGDMHPLPGGNAYEYRGSTNAVEWLIEALNNLEHFQSGWK